MSTQTDDAHCNDAQVRHVRFNDTPMHLLIDFIKFKLGHFDSTY